ISFGGEMQFHLASDVARQFITAAFEEPSGAQVFDLGGPVVAVSEIARIIDDAAPGVKVTVGDGRLPFPVGFDDSSLRAHAERVYETPLGVGVSSTIEAFRGV